MYHFGDKSFIFKKITCIGTDNSKQTRENSSTYNKKHKINTLAVCKKNTENPISKPNQQALVNMVRTAHVCVPIK